MIPETAAKQAIVLGTKNRCSRLLCVIVEHCEQMISPQKAEDDKRWRSGMAEKRYLFGLDIGTGGSKGIITDLDGTIVAYHYCEHDVSKPKPGWAEHDAQKVWWQDFKVISRNLLDKAGIDSREIAAIGCSALSPDMLPVDDRGEPLRPAILYGIDTRTSEEINLLNQSIGEDKIYEVAGRNLSAQSIGPKISWLHLHEPENFRKTAKFLTATSYLVSKLTGVYTIDFCNAMGFTPLFDCRKLRWDEAMCAAINITSDQLPKIYPADQVVGKVTAQAAAETGLSRGTPVINGTADFAAELLSTGANQGDTVLIYGSTMLILSIIKEPVFRPLLLTPVFPGSEMYIFGGGTATAALITKWFRDNLGETELEMEKESGISAYQLLSQKAERVPVGSEGLIVLPYFSGERSPIWDEKARGMIFGLTLSHTKAHIYRAVLEGIAYSVKHHVEIMREAGVQVRRFISAGGGTKSRLWVSIVSDVTGIPQECVSESIGAPLGDAYLAGYGAGIFKDLSTLRKTWVKRGETVKPHWQRNRRYQDYYQVYRSLYPHTKEDMHRLALLGSID